MNKVVSKQRNILTIILNDLHVRNHYTKLGAELSEPFPLQFENIGKLSLDRKGKSPD